MDIPVAAPIASNCVIDLIRIESCGQLVVVGWASPQQRRSLDSLRVRANSSPAPLTASYRQHRADVKLNHPEADDFWGICFEFQLPDGVLREVELSYADSGEDRVLLRAADMNFACRQPDYSMLRFTEDVLHRDGIYASGYPSAGVNEELALLAGSLGGRILDFGCGLGLLVAILRKQGIEAEGLELDRPAVTSALQPYVKPFIRLYDGTFPLPYETDSFDWVICSEVLEHVSDYAAAVRELARIARQGVLFTVPDMSSVPLLHKHNVVPWHLLEATHVNFFTQQSLEHLLRPHLPEIDFLRICPGIINGTTYWTSLVAVARHARQSRG